MDGDSRGTYGPNPQPAPHANDQSDTESNDDHSMRPNDTKNELKQRGTSVIIM